MADWYVVGIAGVSSYYLGMGRIMLLPDEVASQVAAGEVVERPASVVKELVENSLDAAATRIEIAIVRGGSSIIRVLDNGIGMDRDDALLSLERHATSKIRTGHDLARIRTLGFRGEALPSIASVSKFRLATRAHDAVEGTEIVVHGGKIESVHAAGEAPGTQIEVRSLFYNLPARRKFLRSDNTESSHVQHQLLLQAIGHPEVGFVFVRDQSVVFQAPPAAHLADRIRDLRGKDLIDELLEIERTPFNGVTLSGFIGRAGASRSNRSEQIVFVNGRPIESMVVNQGLREGYHTALMRGQYPVTFLFVELDPEAVDVNVHPAKREVRFREPFQIREAIAQAVQSTLESDRKRWTQVFQPPSDGLRAPGATSITPTETPTLIPSAEQFALRKDWMAPQEMRDPVFQPEEQVEQVEQVAPNPEPISQEPFKILGILGKLYVLMENEEGLVVLDQHAAHERILFERLQRQMEEKGVPSQRLLIPLTVQVGPKDYDWIQANTESLQKMGFALEPFGEATLKIDAIPQFFRVQDPTLAVRRLVDELRSMTTGTSRLRMGEDVIAKTVCRHAIKANDDLRPPEVAQLVRDLLQCHLPYCCPHGRPTMIQVGYPELEKKFGRKT